MKRPKKKSKASKLTPAERVIEETRAIRAKLWKEAGGSYQQVVEIGRREGSLGGSGRGKRKSA